MLIGIDPRVTPELLSTLALMGHGDEIVIADRNYPATWSAAGCIETQVIQYPGHDAVHVADLITTLMPLDTFHTHSVLRMEIDGEPDTLSDAHTAVWELLGPRLPEGGILASLERQAFYRRAGHSFAVVQCSEDRPFGCFILRKGVIF
ncbi:RbsD/FucU family protein [Marivita hallyeonensis]|uniref:L-fucose mutarotase n=1 Tax=Marivita hallyeonensis TaxID=996342 RepID=A0A1M5SF38_9RHOB|nr:RbsD/FucU domain-containing protein [Marivita hallyeonensis]SHH37089.1 L-fucose mutarotase [Marivita hallyeonensis]